MKIHKFRNNLRINIFCAVIVVLFFFIIFRLFQIQVINASKYKAQAREQQWNRKVIPAKRGSIYTSDGYPLAISYTAYNLYIDKNQIKDESKLKKILTDNIPDIENTLDKFLNDPNRKWYKIADNLSWDIKTKLTNEGVSGFHFEEVYLRKYPESPMLGNVMGYVGSDEFANYRGFFGLEQYYEGDLRGQHGWNLQEISARGDPILWAGSDIIEPIMGSDLYLTIDRNIQYTVDQMLNEGALKYGAKSGLVIIMDPQTGKIIAMSNYPQVDPNEYNQGIEALRNMSVATVYEPGSVMKAITMAAAIDKNLVTPETTYNDTGPKVYSNYVVDNWDKKHHGVQTMIQILQKSNNLGAAWVGQRVGDRELIKYFSEFGFGSKTGIDLEGEETGIMNKKFPLKDIELVNASFGQGISVTPIQLVQAFSAFANGGRLYKPYIVEKIVSDGKETLIQPQQIGNPISEKSAQIMSDMLTEAAAGGEAKYFVLKNYKIAGKTGTAQIPVKGGYDPDRTNASFVGFMPSYNNFVMLVKLEEPKTSGYASETAVPLWMEIAKFLADYYGKPPDKQTDPQVSTVNG